LHCWWLMGSQLLPSAILLSSALHAVVPRIPPLNQFTMASLKSKWHPTSPGSCWSWEPVTLHPSPVRVFGICLQPNMAQNKAPQSRS
jgi:hypothetical protein